MTPAIRSAALALALALALPLAGLGTAAAQAPARLVPQDVQLGRAVVDQKGLALRIDDALQPMAPDARVHHAASNQKDPQAHLGQEHPVLYRRDAAGTVQEIWLLTEADYDRLSRHKNDRSRLRKAIAQVLNERIAR